MRSPFSKLDFIACIDSSAAHSNEHVLKQQIQIDINTKANDVFKGKEKSSYDYFHKFHSL